MPCLLVRRATHREAQTPEQVEGLRGARIRTRQDQPGAIRPLLFDNTEAAKLKVDYLGIDVRALGYTTTGDIDFAFFGDEGEKELILSRLSEVDIEAQTIKVDNAFLDHFSRYGWVR